jgi:hypothetical protein
MNYNKFGMGFVSNSKDDQCDFLYAHSWSGQGGFKECNACGRLGKIDVDDFSIQTQGMLDYDGGELTGTGDGRLYAFAGNPAKLIDYDKSNANVNNTYDLGGLTLTNAFAFAFFGGDFYFFTESANPSVSKVTHYDFDDTKEINTVVNSAPIRIVGAGVSTCVPLAM